MTSTQIHHDKIMSIEYITESDLLKFPNNIDAIGHCCNCQHIFGGGIALVIKNQFPKAYEADCKTDKGDGKLGQVSVAKVELDGRYNKYIFNIYGQASPSTSKRAVNYEAIASGLELFIKTASMLGWSIGFPKFMGSALAGGDWEIILAMIETYGKKYGVNIKIVSM